ncbi:PREDICTED: syntaxin-11-like [Cyprinodon variegatus]|uniref:syntaxin-11-like n=1 Tax=Cyprinodon variegatus TaxID=28743 RepID=UPI000742AB51|nr:PREDICTED: syntaxin-11-like [Cyprinodon variegatus]
MRDKLERLQTISEEQEDYEPELTGPEYSIDNENLTQEAIIYDDSTVMDELLKASHSIRKDINMLSLEVTRLRVHNEHYKTSVRRFTLLKRDSDSIARGIKQQAEAVHVRIQNFGKERSRLEENEGPNSAVSRIARTQYDTLICAFRAVMDEYNNTEENQREICRRRIQRQASIMGKEITEDNLDDLIDKGGEGWTELSQSLTKDGIRSCRMGLCEIKGRHKELMELESRLKELHELFLDIAMLVEEQGSLVDNIQANVCNTREYIEDGTSKLKRAISFKKKNPCLQCCPWLPCWKQNKSL